LGEITLPSGVISHQSKWSKRVGLLAGPLSEARLPPSTLLIHTRHRHPGAHDGRPQTRSGRPILA
jgi:hypothetical protein